MQSTSKGIALHAYCKYCKYTQYLYSKTHSEQTHNQRTSLAWAWLHLSGCTTTDSSRYRRLTPVRLRRSSTSLTLTLLTLSLLTPCTGIGAAPDGWSSSLRMQRAVRSSLHTHRILCQLVMISHTAFQVYASVFLLDPSSPSSVRLRVHGFSVSSPNHMPLVRCQLKNARHFFSSNELHSLCTSSSACSH